jgi:HAD superfamily hydrolase (TIGR01549 family)
LQPENIWQEYLDICPRMTKLMPGALECLELLSSKFKIGILTNGFEGTQTLKLSESGIGNFVDYLQTSERVGFAKPSIDFFQLALNYANIDASEVLYIGDNINTDVWGGLNAEIKTYWYHLGNQVHLIEEKISNHHLFGGIVQDLCHWSNSIVAEF